MRNWNNFALNIFPAYSSRFQTTYEELKQKRRDGNGTSAKGFPDYLWGIETSSFCDSTGLGYRVSRLPMRNWNYLLRLQLLLCILKFPDYLWGIETNQGQNSAGLQYAVSRLPMRNWNSLHSGNCWRYRRHQVSRLPMRNWNKNYGSTKVSLQ